MLFFPDSLMNKCMIDANHSSIHKTLSEVRYCILIYVIQRLPNRIRFRMSTQLADILNVWKIRYECRYKRSARETGFIGCMNVNSNYLEKLSHLKGWLSPPYYRCGTIHYLVKYFLWLQLHH